MILTRRRFVQLIGATLAAVNAPPAVIAKPPPLLLGDGINNDAPALSALIARQPVEIGPLVDVTGAGWDGNTLKLPRGEFRADTPIVIEGHEFSRFDFEGSRVTCFGDCGIKAESNRDIWIENATIISGKTGGAFLA